MSGETLCEKIKLQFILSLEKTLPTQTYLRKKRVILIAGPTGSGKTALSLILAKNLSNCEVISADSMQVYRGMDIGTAKATLEQRAQVPHHLIDIRDVDDPFNVVDFYYEARQCMDAILSKDHCPIVVGGAGFYFRALLYGPPSGPPSVPQVRQALEEEMDRTGIDALYARLKELDPTYAASITRGDKHKIIRALEIIILTREPVSAFSWKERSPPLDYDYRCWFVYRPREVLYQSIDRRCDRMLEEGFVNEVLRLQEQGIENNPSACQAIGYHQCLDFLRSPQTPKDLKEFLEKFKTASRHYAKKQFTWFRKEPAFRWLNIELHDIETAADMILQDYKLNI